MSNVYNFLSVRNLFIGRTVHNFKLCYPSKILIHVRRPRIFLLLIKLEWKINASHGAGIPKNLSLFPFKLNGIWSWRQFSVQFKGISVQLFCWAWMMEAEAEMGAAVFCDWRKWTLNVPLSACCNVRFWCCWCTVYSAAGQQCALVQLATLCKHCF